MGKHGKAGGERERGLGKIGRVQRRGDGGRKAEIPAKGISKRLRERNSD